MIIRHAEKPTGLPGAPIGVTPNGTPSPTSLTVAGWIRAGALVGLFSHPPRGSGLAVPHTLLCPGYPDGTVHRVHQTLGPLSDKLGTATVAIGTPEDPSGAARLALTSGPRPVLLCWDHQHIPTLAAMIINDGTTPPDWPHDRFDQVWLLDRNPGHGFVLRIVDQHVLEPPIP